MAWLKVAIPLLRASEHGFGGIQTAGSAAAIRIGARAVYKSIPLGAAARKGVFAHIPAKNRPDPRLQFAAVFYNATIVVTHIRWGSRIMLQTRIEVIVFNQDIFRDRIPRGKCSFTPAPKKWNAHRAAGVVIAQFEGPKRID